MITCGFFNSVNGDRTYNAEQMNNPYKRIISNGVFARPEGEQSDDFKVYSNGEMTILVNKGDGIFDGKWATNDSPFELVVPVADVYNARIDSIVFRVNYVDRIGEIILIQGEASENPIAPTITRNDKYVDYRLANIFVSANAVAINNTDITDTRASSECGFVTHLLKQADITTLYSQWQAQFENWFLNIKETIATTTVISSFSSRFIATENNTISVPINITNYNSVLDILQVYKNGLLLVEGFDYTIDNFNSITLANPIEKDTQISFVVYKSVDGSEAETVVRDIEELYKRIKVAENSLDANRLDIAKLNSEVVELGKDLSEPLWSGASVFGSIYKAEPSKKLSECKNGWILCWCSINQSNNTASNADFNFTTIPKGMLSFLKKESISVNCNLIHSHEEDGTFKQAVKKVFIFDDKVTGFIGNSVGLNAEFVLRAIIEY